MATESKEFRKEFMLGLDTLKHDFPIGFKIMMEDGKQYEVIGYEEPQKSTCMASYPRVILFRTVD